MPVEAIHENLVGRYNGGQYAAALSTFHALDESQRSSLGPESLQMVAQCYGRLGDVHRACAYFVEAASKHIASLSGNASVCLANASLMMGSMSCNVASEWLSLLSLRLPAQCGMQAKLFDAMVARYSRPSQPVEHDYLLGAGLVMASRFASTRQAALVTLLAHAANGTISPQSTTAALAISTAVHSNESHGALESKFRPVSIIVCSHRNAQFAEFAVECQKAFAPERYEIIRISDAQSMCEGYNRGMRAARYDDLVFCHDDIEFISDDIGGAVSKALDAAHVAVCVGARALHGPAWWACDALQWRGWMAYSTEPGKYGIAITGIPTAGERLASGDGYFIASRRKVAMSLGWDEHFLKGFHLYDVDFVSRAAKTHIVSAMPDVLICHQSAGAYDESWQKDAKRFAERAGLPMIQGIPGNLWIGGALSSRKEIGRVARRLLTLSPGDASALIDARASALLPEATRELPSLAQLTLRAPQPVSNL